MVSNIHGVVNLFFTSALPLQMTPQRFQIHSLDESACRTESIDYNHLKEIYCQNVYNTILYLQGDKNMSEKLASLQ